MRKYFMCLVALLTTLTFSSCFKDAPLNAEADIEKAWIHTDNPSAVFYNPTDSLINVLSTDSTIIFNVRHGVDITSMAPQFKLTDGATVSPESGSVHDFSHGKILYHVTSEDGYWHRLYQIGFQETSTVVTDTVKYDFENYELESKNKKYYVWYETTDNTANSYEWATANGGYNLSMGSAKPDEYPAIPVKDGYDGSSVALITRDTGPFGAMSGKRLAAGSMFLGSFDIRTALLSPLQSTSFGIPFVRRPDTLKGYYRYQPGVSYQDSLGNKMSNATDSAAIYAVFYRNHDAQGNAIVLHGNDAKTNKLIVAIADLGYVKPVNEWTPFSVDFNWSGDVDESILKDRGYSLAIVLSSSKDGDHFRGAIGSRLDIDKIRIICKTEE